MKHSTPLLLVALLSAAAFANAGRSPLSLPPASSLLAHRSNSPRVTMLTAARDLKGIKIVEDDTTPVFTYSAKGNGKKWAYDQESAVFKADNKDKKSGDKSSEYVKLDGDAFAVGKYPTAKAKLSNAADPLDPDTLVAKVSSTATDVRDSSPALEPTAYHN